MTVTRWTGTDARARARWRRDGRIREAGARRGRPVLCAGTGGRWGAREQTKGPATTATATGMTGARTTARWSADGIAAGRTARRPAGTVCAGEARTAMTGTLSLVMDAAPCAVWSLGFHAAGRCRTGHAGGLATSARQTAGRANGRRGRRSSATTGTVREATDAAHHAGSSAAGGVRGEI